MTMDNQNNRPAAVRVCAVSDIQCSHVCGTGACKNETPSADAVTPTIDVAHVLANSQACGGTYGYSMAAQSDALAALLADHEKFDVSTYGHHDVLSLLAWANRARDFLAAAPAVVPTDEQPVRIEARFVFEVAEGDPEWAGHGEWTKVATKEGAESLKVKYGDKIEIRELFVRDALSPTVAADAEARETFAPAGAVNLACYLLDHCEGETISEQALQRWIGAMVKLPRYNPTVESELASMTRMFNAACADLGVINEALGLDPNDGGADPILEAIGELQARLVAFTTLAAGKPPAYEGEFDERSVIDRAIEAFHDEHPLAATEPYDWSARMMRGFRTAMLAALSQLATQAEAVAAESVTPTNEQIARAIWMIRREHEDRCDMELEDMGESHPVWEEAAAVAALLCPADTSTKEAE
jgi:hypothetical protein